jgi:hypothetical protein
MAQIDPEREEQRLATLYSAMSDGELLKVAKDFRELTEVAQNTLSAELRRRGLRLPETQSVTEDERQRLIRRYHEMTDDELLALERFPGETTALGHELLAEEITRRGLDSAAQLTGFPADGEAQEFVTIRQFRDLPEALLAQARLTSAGIECSLGDDNMVRLDWFISNLLGGIKLIVRKDDVAAAEEELAQPVPEGFEVPGVGEFEQPRCPRCNSLEITFVPLEKGVALASAAVLSLPLPIPANRWQCEACCCTWKEEVDPAEDPGGGQA